MKSPKKISRHVHSLIALETTITNVSACSKRRNAKMLNGLLFGVCYHVLNVCRTILHAFCHFMLSIVMSYLWDMCCRVLNVLCKVVRQYVVVQCSARVSVDVVFEFCIGKCGCRMRHGNVWIASKNCTQYPFCPPPPPTICDFSCESKLIAPTALRFSAILLPL